MKTKNKNQKGHASIKFILATFAIIFAGVSGIFLYGKIIQAASFTFVQSSWAGGATPNMAAHLTNQTGWTQYTDKTNVSAGSNVALSSVSKTFTDDGTVIAPGSIAPSGGGFTNGTLSSTAISGTGANSIIKLNNGNGGTFDVGVGVFPGAITFDATNNAVWVANGNASGTVIKLDAASGSLIGGPITVGNRPLAIAFDATNNAVWTANQDSNNVSKINAATGAVIGAPIAVGSFPNAIAFDSTNNAVWVGNNGSFNVTKINAATGAVIGSPIALGYAPKAMTFDATNNVVWVVNASLGIGSVSRINAGTSTVIGSAIAVGRNPSAIAFDSTNNAVWVVNKDDNTVTKINATTGFTVGDPIPVGSSPSGIAFDATDNAVFVSNRVDNTVTKINAATGAVVGSPIITGNSTSASPFPVAFDTTNKAVWVGNSGEHTVTKLNVSPFSTPGTFTSATIDFGEATNFTTLSYTKNVPANTTLTMDIRGSVDGVAWSAWTTNVASGGDISAMNGKEFIQYRANLATTDRTVSPTLYDVSISSNYWTFVDGGVTSTQGGTVASGGGFGSGANSNTAVSGAGAGASIGLLSTPPYAASGTFTSAVINLGAKATFTTLAYTAITPTNTTLTVDVRSGNVATPDGTWSAWTTNVANGGSISAMNGNRYFQYRANLATTNTAVTPTLNDLTINYSQYKASGTLLSSVYDTTAVNNQVTSLAWTAAGLTASELADFQVRSSPDNITWSNWCGPTVCDGVEHFHSADNNASLAIGVHPLTTANNDRYIQYKTFLFSGGYLTPTLNSVTVSYSISSPLISNVAISGIGPNSATVSWNTDTPSDSYVNYSTSPSLASPINAGNSTLTTFHRVILTGLASSTHYYLAALSTDAIGQLTTANNGGIYYGFTTTNPSGGGGTVSDLPPTPLAPVVTITADPTSVSDGGTSTITYTTQNVTTGCTKSGDWSGTIDGSGTGTFVTNPLPAGTYTYTMTCTGGLGRTGSGSVTVTSTVTPPPTPLAPVVTITADPAFIAAGGTSVITYKVENVTAGCTKSGNWSGTIDSSGSGTYTTNPLPTGTYTYTITCTGSQNRKGTGSVTVVSGVKRPPTPLTPIVTVTANPTTVSIGGTSTITYTTQNVTMGCVKSGDWSGTTDSSGTGTYVTNPLPAGTYKYTLTCTGGQNKTGSGSATVISQIVAAGAGGLIENGGGPATGTGTAPVGTSGAGGPASGGSTGSPSGAGGNTGSSGTTQGGIGAIIINPITQVIQTTVSNIVTPEVKQTITTTRKNITKFSDTPAGNVTTTTVTALGAGGGSAIALASAGGEVTSFADIPLMGLRLWSILLVSLGIRKKRKPWGTVYDSVTKQPLDPVYVVLSDNTGKEVKTAITDLDGRFGFLVPPGSYQISTKKTNYQSPSKKLAGRTRDELYDNLYFGGEVALGANEVITKNIPMDPLAFDWNEFAKRDKKLMTFYSQNTRIVNFVLNALFYLGLVSVIGLFIARPDRLNLAILIIYGILLILHLLGFKPKTFGTITDSNTKEPLSFAIVRVFRKGFPGEIFHRVADQYGHYYCLLAKGQYYVTIDRKNADESYTTVYTSGLIDAKKGIINENFVA